MKTVLTPEQVAQVLGISRRTVISWLQQGKLKGIKVGNRWRVREEDLDKFIDEPNMYFADYIHRARFVEMQRITRALDRGLIASIYILSSLSKPLDEFLEEGSMDVDESRGRRVSGVPWRGPWYELPSASTTQRSLQISMKCSRSWTLKASKL